ncbi:Pycsar system effector family protein [Streptomyces albus]|uniref:Pycsar system effector family protein n=1 Tax=Streptomyces albus TaxID=1888 RepID=UPI0033DE03F9
MAETTGTTSRTDANLDSALQHATTEIGRTDSKAAALLTLDGLLVAALSLLDGGLGTVSLVLAVIGGVALAAGVLGALLVVRPRLPRGEADRCNFAYFAQADAQTLQEGLAEDRRLPRLQALSALALRKMRALRIAGDATAVAVVTIAAAVLAK